MYTEYRKDARGFLVRINPKRFRRGRSTVVNNRPQRWKYKTSKAK